MIDLVYMNLPKKPLYKAYTMLELLVVLLIFIILSTMAMSAFSGFRDTVTLNEDIDRLKQNVRTAQRASLFLERDQDERWIYGIGLDFSQVENDGTYRIFKWCAPFNDYGDTLSKQAIPNYDPAFAVSPTNGNLGSYTSESKCRLGVAISELIKTEAFDERISSNFNISLTDLGIAGTPSYVLFESVSGKTFFYNLQGNIINYSGQAEMSSSPDNFVLEITSPNTGRIKTVTIFNISGKMKVEDRKI
ncbi:MAG: hypothetical protein UT34_C0001G0261 [candidate division WS6 bacterium GW2011_GWF2_39_15]|uniref:General secretion pathway GspH domain-containing protein n=1 Tax=candidate division WS6 bacterium GW2011_GWF2_39_15 TaxID=1619100 RepID=A0A0G0N077_9BACT|nr:MAG: hypothetical protein UT34_C0001G0261 [candidate division WS6 bacterium GW2011_GWF2_39_15]